MRHPTQPQPHTTAAASGPLRAALMIAEQFGHLPADRIEAVAPHVLVHLDHARPGDFAAWVDALGLVEEKPLLFTHLGERYARLSAAGRYADVAVRVHAHSDAPMRAVAA